MTSEAPHKTTHFFNDKPHWFAHETAAVDYLIFINTEEHPWNFLFFFREAQTTFAMMMKERPLKTNNTENLIKSEGQSEVQRFWKEWTVKHTDLKLLNYHPEKLKGWKTCEGKRLRTKTSGVTVFRRFAVRSQWFWRMRHLLSNWSYNKPTQHAVSNSFCLVLHRQSPQQTTVFQTGSQQY